MSAALNGDVDNYADLTALEGLRLPAEITTDAKVIPTLVSHRLAAGDAPLEAFRSTVSTLEGSVAIGAATAAAPGDLFLALRGSGQALYVGLAEDAFVVASEPYGLVEETARYLRLDGETPSDPSRPGATRGQIVVVHAEAAGDISGVERIAYDGSPLPLSEADLHVAQITTRDVDRGEAPHFLLKEISEAPTSFRKTLRGQGARRSRRSARTSRSATRRSRPPSEPGSPTARSSVSSSSVRAPPRSPARASRPRCTVSRPIISIVEAMPATEFSGFGLRDDMHDTLVIAISQSGTTTDTNRTVDLARDHGATVLGIVNRRNSDLVDKSDGVLYTSDGRDVEMSVASTKAFYAQIAAGWMLAIAIAGEIGALDEAEAHTLLQGLRDLPDAMKAVVATRAAIAAVAQRHVLDAPVLGGRRERCQRDRRRARSGSSSRSSATRRSRVTSPRTRSTSTSPQSR